MNIATSKTVPFRKQPALRGAMRATTAVGGALSAFALAAAFAPSAVAGPSDGRVRAGDAEITTRGAQTTIRQNSDRVVIDWRSFDIDADEAVRFLQPGRSSVALNRVLDGLPTNIRGQLLANGNVWIVNQHGVVFHAGAVVNVGGLLATTSDISNADFMAGNYRFDRPGAPDAKIVNEGSITFGQAGLAAFVAPGVENRGVIAGKMGTVVIAGAKTFAIDLAGDGMWAFTMGEGAKGAAAKNVGRIHNPGGYILISAASARGMVDSQIAVGGVVEATTAEMKGGKIVLSGDGAVEVSGKLDATGAEAGQIGGGVEITGETVHLTASAEIDVSGDAGGGTAKIGGDAHGGGTMRTAARTLVSEGAEIRASAIGEVGDGGEVIVWADDVTGFFGSIEARGGGRSGFGGFAEVSAKDRLIFAGLADLSGASGQGELLLDPANIIIQAAGDDDAELDDNAILFGDGGAVDFTITAATLAGIAADVTLEATNDITVDAAVAKTDGGLTLLAGNDILLNADLTLANGDLTLTADADFSLGGGPASDGAGAIVFGGGALSAGDVTLTTAEAIALGEVTATGGITVTTSDDAITQIGGSSLFANAVSIFDAGAGDITLDAAANRFGLVRLTGDDITLVEDGGVFLRSVDATGDFFATSVNGDIIDTGSAVITVGGAASFTAGDQIDIDIADTHTFGGLVTLSATQVVDFNTAGDVTFGDITATNAADRTNRLGNSAGAVDFTGTVSIAGASDLILTFGGTVTQSGGAIAADALTLASDAGASFTLGQTNAVASLATGGADVGAITLVDAGGIDLAGVAAASLTLTTTGDVTDSAASALDTISVVATGYDITLDETANDFFGAVSANGANVTLTDANSITLAAVTATGTLDVTAGGGIADSPAQTISVTEATTLTAATDVALDTAGQDFGGVVNASGASITLADANDIALGDIDATGDLAVSAGGSITDDGDGAAGEDINVAGATTLTAAADITLDDASNDFVGAVSASGADVTLTDANSIALGAVTATGALDVTGGGAIADSAAQTISVTGATTLTAATDIALDTAGHDFGGAVSASGADITLADANDILLGDIDATGALTVSVGSAITDDGDGAANEDIDVAGATSLTAGTNITLDDASNDFGGAVSASGANITLANANNIVLSDIDATGALTISAVGSIADNGDGAAGEDINVAGATSLAAGTDVTLDDASNDFGGAVSASGASVTLADANDIILGDIDASSALTVSAGGSITDNGDGAAGEDINVAGATSLAASTDITLDDAANDFGGAVSAGGANVTLTDASAIQLGAVTATGNLAVSAAGSITDSAGSAISATGTSSFTARAGANGFDIALDNDTPADRHDFGGAVSADGEDVTLIAANGIELGTISAAGDATADDAIDLDGGAEATDPGALIVVARGGAITDGAAGAVTTTGGARLEATGDVTLDNLTHDFDSDGVDAAGDGDALADAVSVAGATVVVTDMNGLAIRGAAIGADGTFTATTGELSLSTVTATGAAVGVAGAGGVTATDVSAATIALGGAGTTAAAATAATGAVSLERATATTRIDARSGAETTLTEVYSAGALVTRGPVQRFTHVRTAGLDSGAVADLTAITGAAGDIDLLTLDRMTFGGDIAISANEVRTGFLRTLNGGDLTITALTGDVAKLADADIDFAGAATAGFDVALAGGGATTVTDPNGAFGDLVSVTGDAAVSAANGDVVLTRAYDGAAYVHNAFAGTVAITAGGAAAVEGKGALTLGATSVGGDLAVRSNSDDSAGGTDGIAQAAGTAITVTGGASFITGVHGGALDAAALADVTLDNAGNDFAAVRVLARDVALRDDTGGVSLARAFASGDLTLNGAGPVSISDATIGGDLAFTVAGAATLRRVSVGGASATSLAGTATQTIDVEDLTVASGATDLASTGGAIRVDDFSIRNFEFDAATTLTVTDGAMLASAGASSAGGAATLSNVTMTTGDFDAGGILTADAARATALSLSGDAGVRLGAVAVTGAFDATSSAGTITITDTATATPADVVIAAPTGDFGFASGPLVTAEAGGTDATDLRVNDSLGGGGATTIARAGFTRQVSVGGTTSLDAAGSILIPREAAAAGGLHNAFGGAVTIASDSGDVALEAAGAIAFGTVSVGGDSFTVRSNSDNAAAAGAASITQTGAMTVAGDAAFITGGPGGAPARSDVTLTNAGNDFDGDVSVVARNGALFDANGISVTDSRLGGALTVTTTPGSATAGIAVADVATGGAASFDAGGEVSAARLDVGGALTATSRLGAATTTDANVDGAVTVTAATDAALTDVIGDDLSLTAGGTGSLTRVIAKSVNVTSGGVTIAGLSGEDVTIASTGAVDAEDVIADAATVTTAGADIAFREAAVAGALRLNAGGGATAGDVAVANISTGGLLRLRGGNIDVDGTNGAARSRLSVGGALDVDATGAARLTDLTVANGADIAAGGDVAVDDFAFGATTVAAGGDAALSDGATGALGVTAGGAATLTNLRTGGATVTAAGDATLDAMRIDGDLSVRSTGGDIGLGGVNVAGGLLAEADAGAVVTVDTNQRLAAVTISGAIGASFTPQVTSPASDTIGQTVALPGSPAGETRVRETTSAFPVVSVLPVTGGATADVALDAGSSGGLLTVAGDAHVSAAGDVALVDDAIGVRADNDFQGGLTVISGGSVAINDRNALLIGAPVGAVLPSGTVVATSGIDAAGALRLEADGAISQASGSRLAIGGDALAIAGGDLTLANAGNAVAGSVALIGDDVSFAEAGSIRLGQVRARGDLSVKAGSTGRLGAASIIQTSEVTVADVDVVTSVDQPLGLGEDEADGAIVVAGDAEFSTGLDGAIALSDDRLDADRDLDLGNGGNVFGGRLTVRRIAGDARIVEESTPGAAQRDVNDGGVLSIGAFEVGGSSIIRTSDDVVFRGRMTSLLDARSDPPRVSRPGASAPRLQGDAAIGDGDLRLFIANGQTLTIDTTGGGVRPDGGDVRFDRPVDGINNQPPVGGPNIRQTRATLGGLTINAGTDGEIRFRDFVGATNPLGPVDLLGGHFYAGFTFAEATPTLLTPRTRFLFDPLAPDDFFFAGDLRINVGGDLLAAVPPGSIDEFVRQDVYFGVNVSNFTFGDIRTPLTAQAFGFIVNTRQRAGGLFPVSPPSSPDFEFNDCVVGDVGDCTNLPIPSIVNQVLILDPPIFDVEEDDLLELFGSFGNEELWGVPQSFISTEDINRQISSDCAPEEEECGEGS